MSASDGAATVVRCLEKAVIELGKPPKDTNFFTAQFSRQDPAVKELKDQCAAAVTEIKGQAEKGAFDPVASFKPLNACCESRNPELISLAIGCLSELMEFGHLKAPLDELQAAGGGKTLLDSVVEAICSAAQPAVPGEKVDDAVQLKVVQAVLTAVTSDKCEVHDTQLQLAVRTCYSIHLTSQNAVNQSVAKTGLNQMLTSVFDRMEKYFLTKPEGESSSLGVPGVEDNATAITSAAMAPVPEDEAAAAEEGAPEDSAVASLDPLGDDEANRSRNSSITFDEPNSKDPMGEKLVKDVILLFRALCKLAMKQLKDDVTMNDVPMRTKVLSLELLDGLLKQAGPIFRTSPRCVYAVKNYLCMSLIQNSISSIPIICRLTVSIFDTVMSHFKENLKTEIGVFFGSMLLRTLETDNSSFKQKELVLETIHRFVKDGRTIVELFLNYDCDLESEDLYEKLVNSLSRVAQGVHISNTGLSTSQENKVKNQALESLVTIVTSMSEWTSQMEQEAAKEEQEKHDAIAKEEDSTSAAVEQLEEQRTKKQVMNKGLELFADDAKKGLKFFEKNGMLEMTPEGVAAFMRDTKGLNKKNIGDYIGRSKEFNKSVLHAYTDSLDFKSMNYDQSIRTFLDGFRLPGEACMIDPIMEKFAERYYKEHEDEGIFKSPDAAYVLSYSIMMLNTDQHNDGVKVKMTVEDFRRNLRGTNDGEDLDPEFLQMIFTSIKENEITLKDDNRSWYSMDDEGKPGMTDAKVRAQKWQTESEDAMNSMHNKIKDKSRKKVVYYSASTMQHVRPMFEVTRWPLLSAFSQYLEKATDDSIVDQCLQGFKHAIHISCIFCMSTERDTFITSLSKFTQLMTLREMKLKHIHAINTLLHVAVSEANFLQSTWHLVLTSISQVERLRLMGIGAKDESDFFSVPGRPARKATPLMNTANKAEEEAKEEDERFYPADSKEDAEAVIEMIEVDLIDRIFMNSSYYSSEAIVDFTTCLCLVALEEIHNASSPRIFCSQKIVEVAQYNMDRIRIVWSRIWQQMSQHFYKAGCHPNLQIAMYAIDSLRQLSIKFLEKPELESYSFQKEFLQPFVLIIQNNSTEDVHELVIGCLEQVVGARCANLKSGWETVLRVLAVAASDSFQEICKLGFKIVETLINDHFEHATEPFQRFTSCLVAYACNPMDSNIALQAIEHLKTTTNRLAEGDIVPPAENGLYDSSEAHSRPWISALSSLCTVAWDPRAQVRSRALDTVFEMVNTHGGLFTLELWRLVFDRALYPLFDACKAGTVQINPKARDEWLHKSCQGALQQLVDAYCKHLDILMPHLEEFFMYIYSVVAQPSLELSRIGMDTLAHLIDTLGTSASEENWDIILSVVQKIFKVSTPRDFVDGAIAAAAADANSASRGSDLSDLGDEATVQAAPEPEPAVAVEEASPLEPGPQEEVEAPAAPNELEAFQEHNSPSQYGSAADLITPRSANMMIPGGEGGTWAQPTAAQFEAMKLMCTVQLMMINTVGEVWKNHSTKMLSRHILGLVECLEGACSFAHAFNNNRGARTKLWNPTLIEAPPNLFQQEIEALGVYLNLLFSLYGETEGEAEVRNEMAEERLMSTVSIILERYITKTLKPTLVPEEVPEMMAFTPVVIQILQGINGFSDSQLEKHLPQLYLKVVEMTVCTKNEARMIVKDILIRIGTLRNLMAPDIQGNPLAEVFTNQ